MRRAGGEAVKALAIYREQDTAVPRARLPELVRGVEQVAKKWDLRIFTYGHAGDGNLHVNILKQTHNGEPLDDTRWHDDVPKAIEELFHFTVSLGGTLTGEHGVGFVQRPYLPIVQSAPEIEAQLAIKRAWDPAGILNPGKIFL